LLIAGHFRRPPLTATTPATATATTPQGVRGGDLSGDGAQSKSKSQLAYNDEFKLYLTSNISMEDYNMGPIDKI